MASKFKRLLSNLPFNPSLVGKVSFYSKRLRRESSIRRLGFAFIALAMFVQSYAVISPPKSSVSASSNDIISGGVSSREDAVNHCNANTQFFAAILGHFDISCDNLANSQPVTLRSNDYGGRLFSLGRNPNGSEGETPVPTYLAGTLWLRYLWSWDTGGPSTYAAIQGTSNSGTTFFILLDCANLVFIGPPAPPPPPPTVNPDPKGMFDTIDCNLIRGWAFDDSVPTKAIDIHIYIDNNPPIGLTANASRPDVGSAYPGRGNNHGYSLSTPASLKDGKPHTVKIYAIGINNSGALDGINPELGRKTVVLDCSQPPPPPPPPPPPVVPPVEKCPYNPMLNKADPACKPCDESLNQQDNLSCLEFSKRATNNTQNISDANGTTARAGDIITYTLLVKNKGKADYRNFEIKENINDILDYSTIVELNGGVKNQYNEVTWPAKTIKAGATLEQRFSVKVKDPIPQTTVSSSDPNHFDLTMTNKYGNTVNIKLPGSVVKTTETVVRTMPKTGPGTSLVVGFALTAVVAYFFMRARLMSKELELVRNEYSAGGVI